MPRLDLYLTPPAKRALDAARKPEEPMTKAVNRMLISVAGPAGKNEENC